MDRSQVIALINEAARRRGVDPAVLLQIAQRESSLNPMARADKSSASGLFQMTNAGWQDYGGGGDVFDPAANADAGAKMTAANIAGLKASGYPVNPGTTYLAHFSGLGGARSLLGADPSRLAGDILGPEAVKANPWLAGMTVGDMRAWADRKMADAGQDASGASPAAPLERPTSLDNVAMGMTPSGAPMGVGMPLDLAAAEGGPDGGDRRLGMLAGALGGLGNLVGKQQGPKIQPSEPIPMPIPVGMRNSLVAAILQRGVG